MEGIEAIPIIREIQPDVKIIISSGYSEGFAAKNFQNIKYDAILPKPYKIEELLRVIKSV